MKSFIATLPAILLTTALFAQPAQQAGYHPPKASVDRLGTIVDTLQRSKRIIHHFEKGGNAIYKLPGGQLYYESALDLDSDGSRFSAQDPTGQSGTSLVQPNGKSVDADSVPFFVLPGKGFYQSLGIKLGDIAAIIYKGKIEFAIFADTGPSKKLGEGSIALHRSLGHEAIRNGRYHDEAIGSGVITIVFSGSGNKTPQTPQKVRETGAKLYQLLGGKI